ncbi:MAG: hypothetical protein ACOX32_07850 [Bacteroidaceae bacterium]|jgi:hypothetical protein
MDYKQEIKQLLTKLGGVLIANRVFISDGIEIRIEFQKLLISRFGNTLGELLGEGVGFNPPEGLSENALMTGLSRLEHEIDEYFSQNNNTIDAYYLLKVRWACFYSALLNKTGALVKFANIGLDYHKRTDNTSWHRTSDEWNYLINQSQDFTIAFNSLKQTIKEYEVQRD